MRISSKHRKGLLTCAIVVIMGIISLFPYYVANASIYKGDASLIGMIDADGADRQDGWYNDWDTRNSLLLMRLGGSMKFLGNCSATLGLEYLKSDACFLIHTHGTQKTVKFTDTAGDVTYLTTETLDSLPDGELSNEVLVIYGTCSGGKGGSTAENIVNSTYNKGAQHVIGFQDITYVTQTNDFLHQFIHELGTDKETIADAYDNALYWVKFWNWGNAGGIDNVLIRGTTNVKLAN